jgi:hypothetical protein
MLAITSDERNLMRSWVGGEAALSTKLLLRGTVHGFGKEAYWNIIQNKSPLLILIKSEMN